jgi:curved DNA-binding protein CbpA
MVRRTSRNYDWGFPRWRAYGGERGAAQVRLCDREGCGQVGDRPAPKSPNSPDRWWFCEAHAAEYNKGWNYFEGLSAEEAAAREAGDSGQRAYRRAKHWNWGEGDGTRSRAELDALKALELDSDATEADVKAAHRRLAKKHHPDNGGDVAAFQAVQAAYEILTRPRA